MSSKSGTSLKSLSLLAAAVSAQLIDRSGQISHLGTDCILIPETDTFKYTTDNLVHHFTTRVNGESWSGICTNQAVSGEPFWVGILTSGYEYRHCTLPGYSPRPDQPQTAWLLNGSERYGVTILSDPPLSKQEIAKNRATTEKWYRKSGKLCSDSQCTTAMTCLEQATPPTGQNGTISEETDSLRREVNAVEHAEL